MIILIKHSKIKDMSFVSHKDTMDVMQRTLKRAKIDVNYSQGFVKHMLTYATTPLPLGVQSIAEFYAVDCNNINGAEFMDRYNNNSPSSLRATYYKELAKNPNLAANVVASDYMIKCKNIVTSLIESIKEESEYIIELNKKGETILKDVRPMIIDIFAEGKTLWVRSATGNTNLRIDSFIKHLSKVYGIDTTINDITRVNQLIKVDNKLISVEDYLK